MKQIPLLVLFLAFLHMAKAQESDSIRIKKNIVKLNMSSLLLKTISLQYERILSSRSTATLHLGYRPVDSFNPLFLALNWNLTSNRLGSIIATPSYRYYFSKKTPIGFYGELYLRYRRDKLFAETNPGRNLPFIISARENMVSTGTMIGVQFVKRKDLYIDFWMLGVGYGKTKATINSEYNPRDQFQPLEQETKGEYESLLNAVYGNNGKISWNDRTATYTKETLIVPFRGLGFNLGVRF